MRINGDEIEYSYCMKTWKMSFLSLIENAVNELGCIEDPEVGLL